jgi:hypothetical protein
MKLAIVLVLLLAGCGRQTAVVSPSACGPYIDAAECPLVIERFELGKSDYLERRGGLTDDQAASVRALRISDVGTLMKHAAEGYTDVGHYPYFNYGGAVLGYYVPSTNTMVYSHIPTVSHETAHFIEYRLFGGMTAECIGHKNFNSECAINDPFDGFMRFD